MRTSNLQCSLTPFWDAAGWAQMSFHDVAHGCFYQGDCGDESCWGALLQAGRAELQARLRRLLQAWAPMLQKFLRSHDDQARPLWQSAFRTCNLVHAFVLEPCCRSSACSHLRAVLCCPWVLPLLLRMAVARPENP